MVVKCMPCVRLINLLDLWALIWVSTAHVRHAAWHTTRHATWHATAHVRHASSAAARKVLQDGVHHALEFLLLGLELLLLGHLVALEPRDGSDDRAVHGLLVLLAHLARKLLVSHGRLHGVGVVLKRVLSLHAELVGLVLGGVTLSLLNHALDFLIGKATLVVLDLDLLVLAGGLLHSGHVEHTVGIDVESDINLRLAARHGRDAVKVELAEEVAVAGHGALALEHLDEHARLVVGVGGEGLALLGGHGGVALDEGGHHAACGLKAERQRGHVEEEQLGELLGLGVPAEDGGLHSCAECHSLVGVDALARLLAAEEVGKHGLHLWDAG
mmetsp:Transcript_20017/g.41079  ORF Transcript_20017/g.41079 Transcript_20017/m.41079 type:complete len:328 (+) Transcript_20017:110-1093(+)